MLSTTIFLILLLPIALAEEPLLLPDDKQGTMNLKVEKMEQPVSLINIMIMAASIIVLLTLIIFLIRYILRDQKKNHALKEKVKTMDDDEAEYFIEHNEDIPSSTQDIDKFLKEEERRIVNILKQREGICSHATLRVIGNFSKATLSRLLAELEERNIIKKEKRGKKNIVILR